MTATLTRPNSMGVIADRLSDHERTCLRRGFHRLITGDAAGFHYALWVGFGDSWRSVRETLIREGFVVARKSEHDAAPTQRVHEFLRASDEDHRAA